MPNNNDDTLIGRLAIDFRRKIERCDKSNLKLVIQDFPTGCCMDASLLLGRYFAENRMICFNYFSGHRRIPEREPVQSGSHGWLQKDDLIVDITADQFDEVSQRVIVTRRSAWHDALAGEDKDLADYRSRYKCVPNWIYKFDEAYDRIVSED